MEVFREHIVYFYVFGALYFSVVLSFMYKRLYIFLETPEAKSFYKERYELFRDLLRAVSKAPLWKKLVYLLGVAGFNSVICVLLATRVPILGILLAIAITYHSFKEPKAKKS